jgi:hypothetical protein
MTINWKDQPRAEQDDREFCDYESSFRIGREKAELRVREATQFVERIERYLRGQKKQKQ